MPPPRPERAPSTVRSVLSYLRSRLHDPRRCLVTFIVRLNQECLLPATSPQYNFFASSPQPLTNYNPLTPLKPATSTLRNNPRLSQNFPPKKTNKDVCPLQPPQPGSRHSERSAPVAWENAPYVMCVPPSLSCGAVADLSQLAEWVHRKTSSRISEPVCIVISAIPASTVVWFRAL
jgi:hypothetical protein